MNVVTTTLLLLLMTALIANGFPMNRSQRCLCKGKPINAVRCTNIDMVLWLPASPSCDNTETVVKLKTGRRVCLNPASRQGKKIRSSNCPNKWISVQCKS
ncbi:C-X-C motif chemokine 11-1-like [Clupea harengus]|uniref:C-X-C motif chemokine 11-1-like n=1 Tax=Clupea harengus TaxID=7950 RepID=A0A6P8FQV4_CLUHA|nr:C-X-C motif chemokine 11-1-like [Clupea harengus]